MFCGKEIEVWVTKGYGGKFIKVKCGNTSPSGEPYMCEACEKVNSGRNWRKEAIEAGENWSEEDY